MVRVLSREMIINHENYTYFDATVRNLQVFTESKFATNN
jgi:hypothetical protein